MKIITVLAAAAMAASLEAQVTVDLRTGVIHDLSTAHNRYTRHRDLLKPICESYGYAKHGLSGHAVQGAGGDQP